MNEDGAISGFILSKVGVIVAVAVILGSALTFYGRFQRTTREERLGNVLETVSATLREADSLPGRVELRRDLPSVEGTYRLFVSDDHQENGLVEIGIFGSEDLKSRLFLLRDLSSEWILVKNPGQITVKKSKRISVEVK